MFEHAEFSDIYTHYCYGANRAPLRFNGAVVGHTAQETMAYVLAYVAGFPITIRTEHGHQVLATPQDKSEFMAVLAAHFVAWQRQFIVNNSDDAPYDNTAWPDGGVTLRVLKILDTDDARKDEKPTASSR